jgi:hypothetical protein
MGALTLFSSKNCCTSKNHNNTKQNTIHHITVRKILAQRNPGNEVINNKTREAYEYCFS